MQCSCFVHDEWKQNATYKKCPNVDDARKTIATFTCLTHIFQFLIAASIIELSLYDVSLLRLHQPEIHYEWTHSQTLRTVNSSFPFSSSMHTAHHHILCWTLIVAGQHNNNSIHAPRRTLSIFICSIISHERWWCTIKMLMFFLFSYQSNRNNKSSTLIIRRRHCSRRRLRWIHISASLNPHTSMLALNWREYFQFLHLVNFFSSFKPSLSCEHQKQCMQPQTVGLTKLEKHLLFMFFSMVFRFFRVIRGNYHVSIENCNNIETG